MKPFLINTRPTIKSFEGSFEESSSNTDSVHHERRFTYEYSKKDGKYILKDIDPCEIKGALHDVEDNSSPPHHSQAQSNLQLHFTQMNPALDNNIFGDLS